MTAVMTGTVVSRRSQSSVPDRVVLDQVAARLSLRDYQRAALGAAAGCAADPTRVHVLDLPTGAGKTRVDVALAEVLLVGGVDVLWVTKGWHLLDQAAVQLATLLPHRAALLRRLGGEDTCLRHLRKGGGGRLYLTTLQTWQTLPPNLRGPVPDDRLAVIWDEVHWGVHSLMGRRFLGTYLDRAVVYGLTATPVLGGPVHIAFHQPPEDLWGAVLASPQLLEIDTGVMWDPVLCDGDFAPGSLQNLSCHAGRNARIVAELLRGMQAGSYRRTLVFACTVEHAAMLARALGERGVSARATHCRMPWREQDEATKLFREGRVAVLVNVALLTEGFDVPEVDAVFLTRPTRSRLLLTQMIGRGARKAPGKHAFHVVEFSDGLCRPENGPVRARTVIRPASGLVAMRRQRPVHHQEPMDAPRFEDVRLSDVGTLPFAAGQTFGVEIELTAPGGVLGQNEEWQRTARTIIDRLGQTRVASVHQSPLGYHAPCDPTLWKVTYDGSAGWEVVSPILGGPPGLEELQAVCNGLTALVAEQPYRLCVNHRTGLHVTLATRLNTDNRLLGFVRRVQRLEPGLFTLTGPSRLYAYSEGQGYDHKEGNLYCEPLRALRNMSRVRVDRLVRDRSNRYHSVNLTRSREAVQLLEVRLHGGTTEFRKVALWLALWMQIFNRARYVWEGPGLSGPVLPGADHLVTPGEADAEDIVKLLAAEDIPLNPEFARLLRERRRELRPYWERVLPLRVVGWERAGWYAGV